MSSINALLQSRLELRKSKGIFRTLPGDQRGIDFWSNDYLGVAKLSHSHSVSHSHSHSNSVSPPIAIGAHSGSTGSRLISGDKAYFSQTEERLAGFYSQESCLFFTNGYAANLALIQSLAQRGDVLLMDELVHASFHDGRRLSHAQYSSFKHNNLQHLEELLQENQGKTTWVVVESLYSMDGDFAPLNELVVICEKWGAYLIVDEAHSNGLYGTNGSGLVIEKGLQNRVSAVVYTFGKAFGRHGAVIAGSNDLKSYLVNFARPFIFTTAPAQSQLTEVMEALELIEDAGKERLSLIDNINYFRSCIVNQYTYSFIDSHSPIQGLWQKGTAELKAIAGYLKTKDILCKAILSPTVPEGTERIRICLHSYNTKEEIDTLFKSLDEYRESIS